MTFDSFNAPQNRPSWLPLPPDEPAVRRAERKEMMIEADPLGALVGPDGLTVESIALDWIDTRFLTPLDATEPDIALRELTRSIFELGLLNPIVLRAPAGEQRGIFDLVQGRRRLAAVQRLWSETRDRRWARIPARVLRIDTNPADLYRRIVDENTLRRGYSHAEMAQMVQTCLSDENAALDTAEDVISMVFRSMSQLRRNHIARFVRLLERVGPLLKYPTAIPRELGLALEEYLSETPDAMVRLSDALADWDNRSVDDELGVLHELIEDNPPADPA